MAVPAGVRIITDPNTVLVLLSMPHKEEQVFPGEKPEGEVAAEEPKEPEVIKTGAGREGRDGRKGRR